MKFQYETKAKLYFGSGVCEEIGKQAVWFGSSAMIVTGGNSAKASGLLDEIRLSLQREGIDTIVFSEARPNPLISIAEWGAQLAREHDIDLVVAVGGGSTIDLAKGICARARSERSIVQMIAGGIQAEDALPLIAVPTTCGTGTEVNRMGVLTNDENHDKRAIKGPALVPALALVDPRVMMTMPKGIYASVAFDALCHLMEAFLTVRATPMSDAYAREGIRLMKENLVRVYDHPEDAGAWEKVTFASTLGGFTLDSVSVIAPHAMSHPLGSLKDIAHGRALASIAPVVYRALADDAPRRVGELSRMLGGSDAPEEAWKRISQILHQINLTDSLRDMGFTEEDLVYLTYNTIQVQSWVLAGTPGIWEAERVQRMFRQALCGDNDI